MSNSSIVMDFAKSYRQANQLEAISEKLSSLSSSNLSSTLQDVSGVWKGESSSKYLNKGMQLQEKINKTSRDLRRTAETIRSITRRLQAAEAAAKAIIK